MKKNLMSVCTSTETIVIRSVHLMLSNIPFIKGQQVTFVLILIDDSLAIIVTICQYSNNFCIKLYCMPNLASIKTTMVMDMMN